MRFGARRVAINALALVAVSGAITLVPPISAQTRDRGAGADMFRPFGAGSEIGVSVRELTNDEVSGATLDSPGGVYVQRVREGSPAARAGLRAGDIIVSVDGERVRGVRQFSRFVLESPAGRSVRAEIVRDGSRQVMSVTPEASARFAVPAPELREELERMLRTLPPNVDLELPRAPRAAQARLGITMTPLTDQLAMYFGVKEGVLVSAVETGFDRAFTTIFDTNATTVIAAVFLFLFGTGPVRGFAVTLTIGLFANLFTAVYVSRTIFEWILGRQARPTRVSVG